MPGGGRAETERGDGLSGEGMFCRAISHELATASWLFINLSFPLPIPRNTPRSAPQSYPVLTHTTCTATTSSPALRSSLSLGQCPARRRSLALLELLIVTAAMCSRSRYDLAQSQLAI